MGYSEDEEIEIQAVLNRYLVHWPWIVLSVVVMLAGAYVYLRYTPNSYNTTAKVKILTDKEASDLSLDLDKLLGKGNVNLENETAVLNSFRINQQVVEQLNLQTAYFQTGRVSESQIFDAPFVATYVVEADSIQKSSEGYEITVLPRGYKLLNIDAEKTLEVSNYYFDSPTAEFPFTLAPKEPGNISPGESPVYRVTFTREDLATQRLVNAVDVTKDGKDSDILTLSLDATNGAYAQAILNALIEVYIEDGILDRQEVSKRTISFIDERFTFLTAELDSIEGAKGSFKQSHNLSIFEADAASVIEKRAVKDEQLFEVETQLLLADVLEKSMTSSEDFQLLPANIGLSSNAINNLVSDYNAAVLEYNKMKASAGANNPQVKILRRAILDLNRNIESSLKGYTNQLEEYLEQNKEAQILAEASFKTLPNKEKILRSIERQQELKENLYLLLLQKREEAAISMATTAPNAKVIDYGITNPIPVAPKRKIIYLGVFILGVLIPIGFLYLKFALNTRIHTGEDVEELNPNAGVLGQIPTIQEKENGKKGAEINYQVAESFRTLAHHVRFALSAKNTEEGLMMAVTSSVKGEGKTTVSFNLSETYFQLEKNVLLVGADLRNPQLHNYVDKPKVTPGLSNYLSDNNTHWQDLVLNIETSKTHRFDLLLSGPIPPMPSVLLSSTRFKTFLEEARQVYDYVIIDTAPTVLVADTLTFVDLLDLTLYVVRSGVTNRDLVTYSKKLVDDGKIPQLGYVVNDIDYKGFYGYGYNYGYGYGYHAEMDRKKWYQFWR